ncbi:class I SAM-dependent methyltransferase [uncultured Kriegella sp.]|uniref:class I SAM-dependent methyltransferase n=1 Tax=uncultured Kriegella sp. TaxID=1798910 RepID=UPI0030DB3925|tara:strand:- start:142765 stop:143484 length:720 start_codon:yes stop_codon:yes gene_type:complete
MKKEIILLLLFTGILTAYQCTGQETVSDSEYTFKKGDPNGIGKWYMGREIANVMGFQGMEWLDRPEREGEENTSKLLLNMDIDVADDIADIGAGSGYHVFKMSSMARKGLIYAVDIQDEMLAELRRKKEKGKIKNVTIVKGGDKSINLPKNSIDKVLLVDVYHEFDYPFEMIASIKNALRPDGKLFLIEYRGEDDQVPIKKVHKMTEKQAVAEMRAGGMHLERNINNLPWQHCLVFIKK